MITDGTLDPPDQPAAGPDQPPRNGRAGVKAIAVGFGIVPYLLAIGVVIILGAVVGLMWEERGLSFRAAFGKPRRAR